MRSVRARLTLLFVALTAAILGVFSLSLFIWIRESFQQESREDIRRILKTLAPDRDEWERDVERLIQNYRTA